MITVNGKNLDIRKEETVLELLKVQGYRVEIIVVEYNGVILKKNEYGTTVLKDGDNVEVISFVGGG